MNITDLTRTVAAAGWLTGKDEMGDRFAIAHGPDRIVELLYGLRSLPGQQQLEGNLSLSTEAFTRACTAISGQDNGFTPLIRAKRTIRHKTPQITQDDVHTVLRSCVEWAAAQDLMQGLMDLAALPTSAPGQRPIWHLGALAVLRDINRLEGYLSAIRGGDRLGFANSVTEAHVVRAIEVIRTTSR